MGMQHDSALGARSAIGANSPRESAGACYGCAAVIADTPAHRLGLRGQFHAHPFSRPGSPGSLRSALKRRRKPARPCDATAQRPPQHPPMMTFAEQRQARAAQYRLLAGAQLALMHSSELAHVRDKHELAAARWGALAEVDELPREGQRA